MSNVIRLVNGGSIQVRTGVLQGIGPQGPRGLSGPAGPQGEQGPIGEVGPIGQILKRGALSTIANNNSLAANTDTVISFGTVPYDDFAPTGFSLSAMTLTDAGDYMLSTWLRFDDAAAGLREVWFVTGSTIIARSTRQSVAGSPFFIDLAFQYRAVGGESVSVVARTSAATGVSQGSWAVSRVGSGPPGVAGPQGVQGPVGATGAAGPAGPAGTANSGFTKYGDLLPH